MKESLQKIGALSAAVIALAGCGDNGSTFDATTSTRPVAVSTMLPEGGITPTILGSTTTEAQTSTTEANIQDDESRINAAVGENGVYQLMDSDGNAIEVNLTNAEGFTPDADLRVSDISPNNLDPVPADVSDFQAYLNTARDGFEPLAGYSYGTNDYNQYSNHESGPQAPMFGWLGFTGLEGEFPGIGELKGAEGRAFMLIILNRTERVYRFPTNSVKVIAGWSGAGRLWNGEANYVQEAEKRLVNHYRSRLGQGDPESGLIGQCDLVDNCNSVLVVTVERVQWGNNPDGSPRDQFRLIRAEVVPTVG